MRRDRQALALERRRLAERARVRDPHAVRVVTQVVAAVVLGVKLRPLRHRGDIVDRRLDAVARLVATSGARLRLGFSGHG